LRAASSAPLTSPGTEVPRAFVHWPSDLAAEHVRSGAALLRAIVGAQLGAIARGDLPTRGDLEDADPALRGGATY
jgi:hypothetical protein